MTIDREAIKKELKELEQGKALTSEITGENLTKEDCPELYCSVMELYSALLKEEEIFRIDGDNE